MGGGGGALLVPQYWGGGVTRHFFLLTLYNFENIGGGGGGHVPPYPPSLWSLTYLRWNASQPSLCVALQTKIIRMNLSQAIKFIRKASVERRLNRIVISGDLNSCQTFYPSDPQ